jgi:hypothetical protein
MNRAIHKLLRKYVDEWKSRLPLLDRDFFRDKSLSSIGLNLLLDVASGSG